MWVKICANTCLEDALLAAELGADAVGFVFAPSVRQMVSSQVASITRHLPMDVDRVGVFPAWGAEEIRSAVVEAGLTSVQLHAAFNPDLVRALRYMLAPGIKIIQAVHWTVDTSWDEELRRELEQIEDLGLISRTLVDSKVGSASGGTGTPFDWKAAEALFNTHPQLILAGGLNPSNIRQAKTCLQPWGVDVASGVEARPGRKDPEKLRSFINEAKHI